MKLQATCNSIRQGIIYCYVISIDHGKAFDSIAVRGMVRKSQPIKLWRIVNKF